MTSLSPPHSVIQELVPCSTALNVTLQMQRGSIPDQQPPSWICLAPRAFCSCFFPDDASTTWLQMLGVQNEPRQSADSYIDRAKWDQHVNSFGLRRPLHRGKHLVHPEIIERQPSAYNYMQGSLALSVRLIAHVKAPRTDLNLQKANLLTASYDVSGSAALGSLVFLLQCVTPERAMSETNSRGSVNTACPRMCEIANLAGVLISL